MLSYLSSYEDGTECSETSAYKIQAPGNFSSQTFSRINTPTFSTPVILHTYPPMKTEQSIPKRRHIKFRCRGITQEKVYNFFAYIGNLTAAPRSSSQPGNYTNHTLTACIFINYGNSRANMQENTHIHSSIQFQLDAQVTEFILSGNCSTCFGRHHHPSSGAQNNCNYSIW